MATEAELRAAKLAMLESDAWAAVFNAGTAELLARAALEAAERVREREAARLDHGGR